MFFEEESTREQAGDYYLDVVQTETGSVWYSSVQLEGRSIRFKLDTGAEVTAIPEAVYRDLPSIDLQKSTRLIRGPANQELKVLGQFTGQLAHEGNVISQPIFVIKNLKNSLLGLPAISGLHLLHRSQTMGLCEIQEQFKGVFEGLGTMGEEYTIQLKDGAKPHALHTPRRVPIPLQQKVKEELDRMQELGVISKVDQPSPWCAGMVAVPKQSGQVRICVDLRALNENVAREFHPIPRVDEVLAQLSGATLFSKLDANSGFWQIPLAEQSRLLTTFITPEGRFCFNKLPFGISSAPELFQKRMKAILEGLEGVVCLIDDVLVFGPTEAEHDSRLTAVLQRLEREKVTLNADKCEFKKSEVRFLGHVVNKNGISPDPRKTKAVLEMESPQNLTELRRFMGMINQLGKFSPRLAELSQPLRELLSTKRQWLWSSSQEQAFKQVKEELSCPTVLALYSPQASSKVSADASSYGLGAVLVQKHEDQWKPVAYASRAMNETERRYAQIEKEALAVTWACHKFSDYILGSRFEIETDHKPLVPLLSSKQLDCLPPRVLRFRLKLARFDYTVSHIPGKLLVTADTLSRAPIDDEEQGLVDTDQTECFVSQIVESLPASKTRLEQIRLAQEEDHVCRAVRDYCRVGWPKKGQVEPELGRYWKVRESLTVHNELLMFDNRIVIPTVLQGEIMRKIHEGHQGIDRCRARVRESVWWPGVSKQMEQMVHQCPECVRANRQPRETLITTPQPEYPWQMVATDLFQLNGEQYLLTVDYFSRYPEVAKLTSTTSAAIIRALKEVFSRHGLPEILRSDNGPQYSSTEFSQFATEYSFEHIMSSPRFPQSNGQAERAVQTVKNLLKKAEDPYLALLSYRATPLPWCGFSPAQLCMGRRIRTSIPQVTEQLVPQWDYLEKFTEKNEGFKAKQKQHFDRRHRTRDIPDIPDETDVWIQTESGDIPGRVISAAAEPRSYVVETPLGRVRRNRSHLKVIPTPVIKEEDEEHLDDEVPEGESRPNVIMTRSRTGTEIRPPDRLA